MPVKTTNNAAKFLSGRKKAAAQFTYNAAIMINARAQQYMPMDTGALKNDVTISRGTDIGDSIIRSTIVNGAKDTIIQSGRTYAEYLHDPKPGGKLDGWQPVLPDVRAMSMSAKNYPASGESGGYNPSARQGWYYIGADEAKPAVDAAFKDIMRI